VTVITGKTVSTKKDDLDAMLEQFDIHVENPVAVLNQDTSKNFLWSKNPKDKYKVRTPPPPPPPPLLIYSIGTSC